MNPERYDVVVLGGGLAGLCLARLLDLEVSGLRVLTLDTAAGPTRRVGESTVEIGAHFLHTRLQLADLLARTQLPKNGLRYWFDDEAGSLPFDAASEDGPATFSYWRSYQLERETFERDLAALNRGRGVTHHVGVRELEAQTLNDGRHEVRFVHDGREQRVAARWLVDATAVGALPSARPPRRDARLTHSACWTWFNGGGRIDDLVARGPTQPCLGPRALSTNHVLGEGYWVWAIPLASGLLSVGLVYDHTVFDDPPRTQDELVAFLRSHRMLRDLLADATPQGFGSARDYSRRPGAVIDPARRAWIGLAAGFADPFYSNGIDMLALEVEALADVIRRDQAGEGLDPARIAAYERAIELFYEQVVVFVGGLYPSFASHELSVTRYRRDIHVYWTLFTWAYLSGRMLDLGFLERFLPCVERSLERGRGFARVLRHAHQALRARGALRRDNARRYTYNQLGFRQLAYVRCERLLATAPDLDACERALDEIDAGCFLALLDSLFDGDRSPTRGLLVAAVQSRLPDLTALTAGAADLDDAFWAAACGLVAEGLRDALARAGVACGALALDPARYRRWLDDVLAACPASAEPAVRAAWFALPELEDFAALPPIDRAQAQPPRDWSAACSPWLTAPLRFETIYELLGEEWLQGRAPARWPTEVGA